MPSFQTPGNGWFPFGSHADFDGPLEFSEEVDDGGMPLWERHPTPAPSDIDREALAKVLMGLDADDDWGQVAPYERVVFYEQADGVIAHLAAVLSHTPHPVQVEVTDDMVERGYRGYVEAKVGRLIDDDHHRATYSTVERAYVQAALLAALGGGK